jgi:hypothetical protein
VREGVDGFLADDAAQMAFLVDRVADLDRTAIRADVLDRFSARRMVDGYEEVYARVLSAARACAGRRPSTVPSPRPSDGLATGAAGRPDRA